MQPGRNAARPKQALEPLPAREFNSALSLRVTVREPGGQLRFLETPAKRPLVIPAGIQWDVSPRDKLADLAAVIREVRDQQLPGLSLSHLDDAGAERLAELTHLRWLSLSQAWVTDAGLAHLSRMSHLQSLCLLDAPATGAGLASLTGLTHLAELQLSRTKLTEAGCAGIGQLRALRALHLHGTPIPDRGLAHLEALSELLTLLAPDTPLTDAALPHLGQLRSLEMLNLDGTHITGAAPGLGSLSALRRLTLCRTPFTDAGLEPLSGARELRSLNLSTTKVTGPGLAHLSDLPHLEQLSLYHARFLTDTGFAAVEKLRHLTRLSLGSTRLGDAAVSHLSSLGQLNDLDLCNTRIGDEALPALARLASLRKLDLGDTNVTPAGLAQFKQALPLCEVEWRQTEVTYERPNFAGSPGFMDRDLLPAGDLEDWMREAGAKVGVPRARATTGETLLFLGHALGSESSPEHARFIYRKHAAAQEIRSLVHAVPVTGNSFELRVTLMDVQVWNRPGVAALHPADKHFSYGDKRSQLRPWAFFKWVEATADTPARWEEVQRDDARGRYQAGPARAPTRDEAALHDQIIYALELFVAMLPEGPWQGQKLVH